MKPVSTRHVGTFDQLNPVRSERRTRPRFAAPVFARTAAWTRSARRRLAGRTSFVQPAWRAGKSVERPCVDELVEPSAWIRMTSAACRRLQNFARATFPPPGSVISGPVRVIATRKPRASSTVRVRFAIWRTTTASPAVPPGSFTLRMLEPGPIGSVPRFAWLACPGSRQTSGGGGGAAASPMKSMVVGDRSSR